jgi:hypothetical protein
MARDRTALLIVRAWVEPGSASPLRAQVRLTTDVAAGFAREMTFADATTVCAFVEEWLREVIAQGQPEEVGPPV